MENNESEYHDLTKLLLARMESNPKEFVEGGKLFSKMQCVLQIAPPADKVALNKRWRALRMDTLHQKIIVDIFDEPRSITKFDHLGIGAGVNVNIVEALEPYHEDPLA